MKVILSGSTGFIGGEILDQALAHPSITSIICLTRRSLPDSITASPKIQVIIVPDFLSYPPELLAQLEGSEACIWAMGSPARKNPDLEDSRKVEIGYTLAAAKAIPQYLAPTLKAEGKKFRFLYLSGWGTNRDRNKKVWFLSDSRNTKGEVENGLFEIQGKEDNNLEVSIVRPGGVLKRGNRLPSILEAATLSVRVEELAAVMVNEVLGDVKDTRTLENSTLIHMGRELLKRGTTGQSK